MLGPDWLLDVSEVVARAGLVRVANPAVAEVRQQPGLVVIAREAGVTAVQVVSPLSEGVHGEAPLSVLEERVALAALRLLLVGGLSLTVGAAPGPLPAVLASVAAQRLHAHKQEAVLNAWLEFSDDTAAPLDIYDPGSFSLTLTSLDESVVSVRAPAPRGGRGDGDPWVGPTVTAEGEGRGDLLRAELGVPDVCQKSKRRSGVVAASTCAVNVKFGAAAAGDDFGDYGSDADGDPRGGDRRPPPPPISSPPPGLPVASDEGDENSRGVADASSSAGSTATTTTMVAVTTSSDERFRGIPDDVDLERSFPGTPRSRERGDDDDEDEEEEPDEQREAVMTSEDDDDDDNELGNDAVRTEVPPPPSPRSLTDLEIGMYALLAVFCLAIAVFLVNCLTFALRYRGAGGKKAHGAGGPAAAGGATANGSERCPSGAKPRRPHDWVWLNQPQPRSPTPTDVTPTDGGGPPGRGGRSDAAPLGPGGGDGADAGGGGVGNGVAEASLNSPTSKRKRVKFTTFAAGAPDAAAAPSASPPLPPPRPPPSPPAVGASAEDLEWVCRDMGLREPDAFRNYMERIKERV
ncbi:transmembrane protein 132E-like [Lethenteron reissneri]|uniref:transmembrane protein 132E-like n=1 Tax=Lethenteron reissneri TaxID=7753 RepID=UPI002AB6A63D|nr:transmembrane protein 132E-like [Lethenteron reissneri]